MVAWYKHDIPAWMDGTENLDANAYRAYHVICQLIYLNEGPIAVNERGIAGRCNMHILAFRKTLDHLLTLGKLTLNPNGTLDQPRANLELEKIGLNRVHAGLGGSAPRKSLKNKGPDEASLKEKCTEKTREEETRGEQAPRVPALVFESDWPKDFRETFWRLFPKRVDKQAAFKKLEQLRRVGKVPWATLIGGVGRYAESVRGRDQQYTKSPAAWLNAGKWDDEIGPGNNVKILPNGERLEGWV